MEDRDKAILNGLAARPIRMSKPDDEQSYWKHLYKIEAEILTRLIKESDNA